MTEPPKLVDVANARHSSESNEHYTPPNIIAAARATMGGIDLDPASCALANEEVQAADGAYYENNGLAYAWGGSNFQTRVFLNPPGGLLRRDTLETVSTRKGLRVQDCVSAQAVWWAKLHSEWTKGNVAQAIFVCFNLEVLRLTQQQIEWFPGSRPAASYPICFLSERPRYWNEGTPKDKRGLSGAPTHAGAVVYLPEMHDAGGYGQETDMLGVARLQENFSPLGYVRI